MEVWKDIKGYEELYQVSNTGKVKSIKRNKTLRPEIKEDGYLRVNLYKNGKRRHKRLNRLVAIAFLPIDNYKLQVNHKDCNKFNNKATNLEWVTDKKNKEHSVKNGLNARGSKIGKLKEYEVIQIINQINKNISIKEIAIRYNISKRSIYNIKNNKTWKYIRR